MSDCFRAEQKRKGATDYLVGSAGESGCRISRPGRWARLGTQSPNKRGACKYPWTAAFLELVRSVGL